MKTVWISVALAALPASLFPAAPPGSSTDATNVVRLTPGYINGLAEEMRTNHPALRALEARVRAATHATVAVRTWEDPAAKFGGVVASERGPILREEGDLIYGVDQKLPLFGKAQAARRVAQAEADAAIARQSMQFQFLRRDLVKALFKAAYDEQVIEVGREDLAWLDTMTATTEERYRAGGATQVDVLRLQNERAKRADLLRTDAGNRDQSLLGINRFLNHELHSPLPRFTLPDVAPPVAYDSNLVRLAEKFEPKLRLMEREIRAAEAQLIATRKSRLPDISAGIEGRQYSGDGGFRQGAFTLSSSLPWFNRGRYQSELARDHARLEAAQFDAADYALGVGEDVHRLTVAIDAARREAVLYRDEILPRSRQTLTVARENWLNNRGPFNDVLEARRLLLEAQLKQSKAVAEQYQALSELVLCCGLGDLEAVELFNAKGNGPPLWIEPAP